jgi:hypothetical protein
MTIATEEAMVHQEGCNNAAGDFEKPFDLNLQEWTFGTQEVTTRGLGTVKNNFRKKK